MKLNNYIYLLLLFSISSVYTEDSYTLFWHDEFNENELNSKYWNIENGKDLWGNNELQKYTKKGNIATTNGLLVITANKNSEKENSYSSARINTKAKVEIKYGKIEARILLPYGNGLWPAFWMMGADFDIVGHPKCGEIDIVEMVGGTDQTGKLSDYIIYSSLHQPNQKNDGVISSTGQKEFSKKLADEFHVFGILWNESVIIFQIDGNEYFRKDIASTIKEFEIFKKPYFLILNLAVGGNWPGSPNEKTIWPQEMKIDWIRIYQLVQEGSQS